jgi:glyoxylase-like metal-dependent hydrolase (beta-lactamase superfamily II)
VSAHPEFHILSSRLAIWHAFDPSVKAHLFSTAISTTDSTYLIDPIHIPFDATAQLQTRSPVAGIIVTNQNHWRASTQIAKELEVPIFAHSSAQIETSAPLFCPLIEGERIAHQLEVLALDGGAPGEIALFWNDDGGTVVVGDALIHFEPYGFTFLPPKYCVDHRKMLRSLEQLGARRFERLLFAHGLPILSKADNRLQALLHSG